jgi:hypothetical protein
MTKPTTCCGRGDACVCATEAKCSCGQHSAMHCTCEKKATENTIAGPRCSCSMVFVPATTSSLLTCTLQEPDQLANVLAIALRVRIRRWWELHALVGKGLLVRVVEPLYNRTLLMPMSFLGSCTCEKAADGGLLPDEIDFTTKA